jgi:hypothetical protein
LPVAVGAANHEVIRDDGNGADVQQQDIFAELIYDGINNFTC